jgi:hypothetical protein
MSVGVPSDLVSQFILIHLSGTLKIILNLSSGAHKLVHCYISGLHSLARALASDDDGHSSSRRRKANLVTYR